MRYFLLFLLFIATPMLAVDPECVDPDIYDPATGPYDATEHVRFCTPLYDVNGNDFIDGDLAGCTVVLKSTAYIVDVSDPGALVVFPTPADEKQGARFGQAEAYCSTTAGDGAPVVAPVAMFRGPGAPGVPALLR